MDPVLRFLLRGDRDHVGYMEPNERPGLCDPFGPNLDPLRSYCVYHYKDPEEKVEAVLGRRSGGRLLYFLADLGMDRCSLCPDDDVHFQHIQA